MLFKSIFAQTSKIGSYFTREIDKKQDRIFINFPCIIYCLYLFIVRYTIKQMQVQTVIGLTFKGNAKQ